VILSLTPEKIKLSLENFKGTWRRFEYKGRLMNGAEVYDDYAHHPTEIRAMLAGARELYPRDSGYNIMVIFQPHLFSRTKALLEDFSHCFSDADTVILLPIYKAREVDDGTISSQILSDKIVGPISKVFNSFDDATSYIAGQALDDPQHILITVGAGEAYKVLEPLLPR
jgi:UDP-N-acetylmuramate--alanine ligase